MPRPRLVDALVAVALAMTAQAEVWLAEDMWAGPRPITAVVAAVPPLLLMLARRDPLAALAAAWIVYSVDTAIYGTAESGRASEALTIFILVAATAALGGRLRWLALPMSAAGLLVSIVADREGADGGAWIFPLFFFGLAYLVGQAIRSRDARSALLLDEQETVAHAAVMDERARIARELHDVVAHGISLMVVQAVGGRTALGGASDHPASRAFDAIEETGKQSLAEMRRLLGVLRTVDDGVTLLPQPGLRDLEPLAQRARDAGLDVDVAVTGVATPLPPGVDLCAYRVLQEALTNAIKHARACRVRVHVGYEPNALALEIRDDGGGAAAVNPGGHGLLGMRERIELYGGELRAGREESGGFTVRARLPMEQP